MLRRIIKGSLELRYLVVAVAAALMFLGVAQLRSMPVDVLPEFSPPYVEIQTEALGLSAEEVEQLITLGMEQDLLNGVPWLHIIRSESVSGLSSIVIYFEPGTDLIRARQMVSERLTQAVALPHVSKPPTMLQPLSSASRFLIVGLSSKDLSQIEMSVLTRWTIAPRLMGVAGVANVAVWGQRDRQLQVQVDPEQLRAHGVSLQQVLETAGNALWVSSLSFLEASTPGTGGFIDTTHQRLGIRHISPIVSPDNLAQVPVEGAGSLRLGDVAAVVEDHQPLIGDALTNDGPSLLLVVEKFPGANPLEVTRGVEDVLDALRPGLPGLQIDTSIFHPTTFIETAIRNLTQTLVVSMVLVVVALFALFWNWRTALISLVAIVSSLLAAGFVLYLQGGTFNAMIFAGLVIAIGVIADDAIIDAENIKRRLDEARQKGSTRSAVSIILEASYEMRGTILFATLCIVLVVVPLFFVEGGTGAFVHPLVITYVLAVLVSMVVALTVTPALSMIFLANSRGEGGRSPLLSGLERLYNQILVRTIRTPIPAYILIVIVIVAGLVVLPSLNQDLLPSFKEPYLVIDLDGASGASRTEMARIVSSVSQELRGIAGVRTVAAHIGRAVLGDQVVGINSSELWVSLDPAANYEAAVSAIRQVVAAYPGLRHNVQTYLDERTSLVTQSSSDSATVRVFGPRFDILRSTADDVKQSLTGINGIADLYVKLPAEEPTLNIKVDLAVAQSYGITPGDVRRAAATLLSGIGVGSLFEEQKVFDVVVWSTPETRQSLTSIRELLIDTPSGGHVRLGDIAEVNITSTPTVIQHEAVSRYLDIGVKVEGRDLGSVLSDIEHTLRGLSLPMEYYAEVVGQYAEQQVGQQRILGAVAVALVGIFFLLQAAVRSWRLAVVAVLSLPMALAGGLLAAFLAGGGTISLGSLVGLLTLLGLATRSVMTTIAHYRHLEEEEGETFGPELVLRGSRERLAPTLLTGLTVGLAVLPFILFGNNPGLEVVYPIAVVILGGLVSLTLLNLFVTPALYLRFGSSAEPIVDFGSEPVTAS
jgi:CzcA family heavy metal efflux pump